METIAHTRYGTPITLGWIIDINGCRTLELQQFERVEEHYDAWVALTLYAVMQRRKEVQMDWFDSIEHNCRKHRRLVRVAKQLVGIENELKIGNSFDRANYARTLMRPEFKF